MKNTIRFALIAVLGLILINSCSQDDLQDKSDRIILTGEISGLSDTSLLFNFETFKLLDSSKSLRIDVDSAGKFKLVLDSEKPLKGFISFGKVPKTYLYSVELINGKDSSMQVESVDFRMVYLYLAPGDSISLSVDPDNIQESLTFKGRGSGNNLFVNQEEVEFNSYKDKYLNNYYYLTYLPPVDFKNKKEEIRDAKKSFLMRFQEDYVLEDHLVELYNNQYDQEFFRSLINYPAGHAGFNNGRKPDLPEDYFDFISKAPIPKQIDDMGIGSYYYLNTLLRKKFELQTKGSGNIEFYDYIDKELPERLAYIFKAYALDRDFNRQLYDNFDESCPYPDLAELVKARYGHLEGMLAGNPFPDFILENVDGEKYENKDLIGHFTYIDFWATWCKPCIKEIPYLEKLQEEFIDKPIKFVSISIDKESDKLKWNNFVKEENMKGVQVWADDEHHELFGKSLNIKSIPRFILLDKEGKIIEAQAPRPSDPSLKELIGKLLQ